MAPQVIFIVGPTASGKSALALELARHLDAEIVCADSQTIRRGMNLGTAKPTIYEQDAVWHHMLNIIDPYADYSVAQFQKDANKVLADIENRGKTAIVVGGTGLYVDALYFNYTFIDVATNTQLRTSLATKTVDELQQMITDKNLPMPINNKNPRHLIRTLETGGNMSSNKTPRASSIIVGLDCSKDVLRERITKRVDFIFNHGFVAEVQQLLIDFGQPSRAFDAIAYKLVLDYLNNQSPANLVRLKQLIVTAESQYAKRQITWFKRNPYTKWFSDTQVAYNFVLSKISP